MGQRDTLKIDRAEWQLSVTLAIFICNFFLAIVFLFPSRLFEMRGLGKDLYKYESERKSKLRRVYEKRRLIYCGLIGKIKVF